MLLGGRVYPQFAFECRKMAKKYDFSDFGRCLLHGGGNVSRSEKRISDCIVAKLILYNMRGQCRPSDKRVVKIFGSQHKISPVFAPLSVKFGRNRPDLCTTQL